jgi:LEA14-like dessication related protein
MQQMNVREPAVEISNVSVSDLSFEHISMLFDIQISNPNTVGISLAAFDYDFLINENSFVSGQQNEGLNIQANANSTIQLPITLEYSEIYQAVSDLLSTDSSQYQIKCGLAFDIPVLGAVRVPISKRGSIPMIKLPSIQISGIKLNKLNFTGADLILSIELKNPNNFSVLLDRFNYNLNINGQDWLNGISNRSFNINKKNDSQIEIPISLNFIQMGQSVYQLLSGGGNLNYNFKGDFDISSSLNLLKNMKLPYDQSGSLKLNK